MRKGCHSRSGQAIAELVVAIVSVLVVVAGLIQISSLGLTQTRAMIEARRLAAVKAMSDTLNLSGPEYIADRTEGADGVRYSSDDGMTDGKVALFQDGIVGYALPDQLSSQKVDNAFSALYTNITPQFDFGLVEGRAPPVWVPLTNFPVVKHLLYQADGVEITGRVWLTWTRLY
jgi:hypothetical protein